MFRLLEPASHLTPPDAFFIKMFGKRWVVCEYAQISDAPPYTCISYSWGQEKVRNLVAPEQLMSARTVPAIEAIINVSQSLESWADNIKFSHNSDTLKEETGQAESLKASQAFWIDALCVPSQEPARTACLQSMGEVFSAAFQVIIVLTEQCSNVIQRISRAEELDSSALFVLEKEDWINRAWTYQEAVNSRSLYFVVEGEKNTIVSGQDFLRAIVDAIEAYKVLHKFDNIAWVKHHPRLYNLEALLADYLIADYADRSAYQVMSAMGLRVTERAEDYFYAMNGAITNASSKVEGDETLDPSEYFMRVCERKGDYSFIYSTSLRSEVPGQRWRPAEDRYTAVLPSLITFGSGEAGLQETTHLRLDNMYRLIPGAIDSDGLKAARWFNPNTNPTVREVAQHWLEAKRDTIKSHTAKSYKCHLVPIVGPLLQGTAQERGLHAVTGEKPHRDAKLLRMLGDELVSSLQTAQIRRWHSVVREECGAFTANRCMSFLKSILALAEEDFGAKSCAIPSNLLRRKHKPKKEILSPEEVAKLITNAQTDKAKGIYYAFPFLTGVRVSEQLGLLWDDIDLDTGIINIRRVQERDGSPVPIYPRHRRVAPLGSRA